MQGSTKNVSEKTKTRSLNLRNIGIHLGHTERKR
jgi:hypothetical protein